MNAERIYEECKKSKLDVHISKPAGGEKVTLTMEGTTLDLISSVVHLADRVSRDVASDAWLLIAMRSAVLEKIDARLTEKLTGRKPEGTFTASVDPEKVSELFSRIFGN